MNLQLESFWWSQITGPAHCLQETSAKLSAGSVTLAQDFHYMNWFIEMLIERLLMGDSGLQIDKIDAAEYDKERDIGEKLFHKYAPGREYHPLEGTFAAQLAQHKLLNGRVLIILNIGRAEQWEKLALEYTRHYAGAGAMLLIFKDKIPQLHRQRNLNILNWSDWISPYDMRVFASYCVSKSYQITDYTKSYITYLAANLAIGNPGLCSLLAVKELIDNPRDLLHQLSGTYVEAANTLENGKHIDFLIWEAQVQVIFPIIEVERRRIIETYCENLLNVLPQIDEFGNKLTCPEEMELRHIQFYYRKPQGRLEKKEDDQIFQLIYSARNDLAHLRPVGSETVKQLLSIKR